MGADVEPTVKAMAAALAAVATIRASHSSAPKKKGEDEEADWPPGHEAKDHQGDPGRFSEFVELFYEDH